MKYLSFKYLLTSLLCISGIYSSFAQYPSENGKFEVNILQGCASLTVEITSPCTNCSDYDFNNDANGDGTSFTYQSAGTYTIEAYAAGGISDRINIEVHQDTIPQFNIYRCGGRNVEVVINDDNYDRYRINWGDENTETLTPPDKDALHSYSTSGNKNITVTGLYADGAGNCTPNSQTVTDIDNLPIAQINSVAPVNQQSDQVVIHYTADPNALYKLQLSINSTNNFVPVQDLPMNRDSVVVRGLQLNTNYYCFRIATLNACLGGNPPEEFSSEVCTQVFNVNFTNNEENVLIWNTSSTSATGFSVLKGTSTLGPFTDTSRRSYTDDQVDCNIDYCYILITNYPSGATSTSLQKCGTAKLVTTPEAVSNAVTEVNDDIINVTWNEPANTVVDFYNIFRSVNGGLYNVAANDLPNSQYSDTGLDPVANSYCYQINYKDRCGNSSEMSGDICAIHLRGHSSGLDRIILRWNRYNGYRDGVSHYILEKFSASGSSLGTVIISGTSYTDSLSIDDPQELHYRVTAVPNDGSYDPSISNFLQIIRQSRFSAPNAFIPNGSEENSVFRIVSPFVAELDMKIFNRWGELVYQTNDNETGWPGTDQSGNPLPQGTYVYQVKVTSEAGEESNAYGTVLLLRK